MRTAPHADDEERVTRALGERPLAWSVAPGHGAPSHRRYVVELREGRTAFLKIAAFEYVAEWLRIERSSYEAFEGHAFLPELLGWDDDGVHPVLAIEDLSGATWPPPWTPQGVELVLDALAELHACGPPAHARDMGEWRAELTSWSAIAVEPEPFLSLGVCSPEWLDSALPAMVEAERAAPLDGRASLHMDVRSDNLCFRGARALFVDWNWITEGNPAFDVAGWLPSLELEGGPRPETVMPTCHPGFAALLAGYFCAHAALPPIPQAPHVRGLQLAQARTALPWAARLLELPPPG